MASGIPRGYLDVGAVAGWGKWPVTDARDKMFYVAKIEPMEAALDVLRERVKRKNPAFAQTLYPPALAAEGMDKREATIRKSLAALHCAWVERGPALSVKIRLAKRFLGEDMPPPVTREDMVPPSIREIISKEAA